MASEANDEVPSRAELDRRLNRMEPLVHETRDAVVEMRGELRRIAQNMDTHQRESREGMSEVHRRIDAIVPGPSGDGHSDLRERVSQLTGGARVAAWFFSFLAAAGVAAAAWWDNLVALVKAAGKTKGAP